MLSKASRAQNQVQCHTKGEVTYRPHPRVSVVRDFWHYDIGHDWSYLAVRFTKEFGGEAGTRAGKEVSSIGTSGANTFISI
jgi:hypothetical protein